MSSDCRKHATHASRSPRSCGRRRRCVVACASGPANCRPASGRRSTPAPTPGTDFRGPGFYLSWIKILACWSIFLLWVKTTDWVSIDCQELKLDYLRWNPIVFGTFMRGVRAGVADSVAVVLDRPSACC